jgi:hypothetical protein
VRGDLNELGWLVGWLVGVAVGGSNIHPTIDDRYRFWSDCLLPPPPTCSYLSQQLATTLAGSLTNQLTGWLARGIMKMILGFAGIDMLLTNCLSIYSRSRQQPASLAGHDATYQAEWWLWRSKL